MIVTRRNVDMMHRTLVLLLLLIFPGPMLGAPLESDAQRSDTLRVMVWNVLRGGNSVHHGPDKALDIIRAANVDLVLLQESYDIDGPRPQLGAWLAEELGWNQYQGDSPHLCVLTAQELVTRFYHHPWHGLGAEIHDQHGRAFLAWSIWLDWRSYVTEELRDQPDMSDADVLAGETERSNRLPQVRDLLAHFKDEGHLTATLPLLVGGDWNTPSHLDWTPDTARIFRHRRALPLPVSLAMEEAGFQDAFRMVHPHPVQYPGLTWSPMERANDEGQATGFERIDRLYLKNPRTPRGGWILTPVAAAVLPDLWESEWIAPKDREFPSDHGALIVDFTWDQGAETEPPNPVTLDVLAFNILRGGQVPGPNAAEPHYDRPRYAALAEVIRRSDPDVVLVQEEGGDLGVFTLLHQADPTWIRRGGGSRGQAVYARYPIEAIDQDTSRVLHPAGPLIVHNVHWEPYPYGPYVAQDQLLAGEIIREEALLAAADKGSIYADTYRAVYPYLLSQDPIIVGGDFNEPSHLDWTPRWAASGQDRWVANPTDTPLGPAVAWKGSRLLTEPESFREEINRRGPLPGLRDAYRAVYPDEVRKPGHTWTPRFRNGTRGRGAFDATGLDPAHGPQRTAALDRIDLIYASQALLPIRVLVLGDQGDPATDIGFTHWPSDHRAVLATFRWQPAAD